MEPQILSSTSGRKPLQPEESFGSDHERVDDFYVSLNTTEIPI